METNCGVPFPEKEASASTSAPSISILPANMVRHICSTTLESGWQLNLDLRLFYQSREDVFSLYPVPFV